MNREDSYHLVCRGSLNILLDVPTGAVHVLDQVAVDVFHQLARGNDGAELPHPAEEVERARQQLQTLIDQGLLFAPEPVFSQRPGGGRLKAMCLHVAHDCDLRCKYCFASTGSFGGPRGLMDLDTACQAVDMLLASAGQTCEIDFFGGEPLLNLQVVEQTAAYARRRAQALGKVVNLTLTTNAVKLDAATRQRLAALDLDLVLSHDGREHVHNAMRPYQDGSGSYSKITGNILEMINLVGDRYYVRGTYTAANLDFCQDIRHWLDLGFRRFSLEPVVAPENSRLALSKEHLDQLREQYWQLADLALEFPEPFTFFHFIVDWEQGPCGAKRAAGCGAGVEYVAVDPEGGIYPCHQFVGDKGWLMGHVSVGVENQDIRQSFMAAGLTDKFPCRQCWARYYCGGGCHANAWWANRDLNQPWQLGCELLKIRTEAAIWLKVKQALAQKEGGQWSI